MRTALAAAGGIAAGLISMGVISASADSSLGEADTSKDLAAAEALPPLLTADPAEGGSELGLLSTESCADGKGCFWRQNDFQGTKAVVDGNQQTCCQWRLLSGWDDFWRSSKNRYHNRKLALGDENNVLTCMDPGENRANPGVFDRVKIGSVGSTCP